MANSELSVITKAKDLCEYILTVTDKSPKRFRFTLTSRLQNYALDIIEHLILANEVYVSGGNQEYMKERLRLRSANSNNNNKASIVNSDGNINNNNVDNNNPGVSPTSSDSLKMDTTQCFQSTDEQPDQPVVCTVLSESYGPVD